MTLDLSYQVKLCVVQDEQYVVDYCLKAPWPTFETAEKMLNHGFMQTSSLQIQEALTRLATFCSLHGTEYFKQVLLVFYRPDHAVIMLGLLGIFHLLDKISTVLHP